MLTPSLELDREGLYVLEYHTLESFGAYRRLEQERILFADIAGRPLPWSVIRDRLLGLHKVMEEDPLTLPQFVRTHPEMPVALTAGLVGDHFMVLQPCLYLPLE